MINTNDLESNSVENANTLILDIANQTSTDALILNACPYQRKAFWVFF